MSALFLLQSGYVTPNSDYLVRENEQQLTLRDKLYIGDARINTKDSFYDEKIEKLFNTYREDNTRIKNFNFREDVLRAALRAFKFSTPGIVPWFNAQVSQRTVGYLHRRFMVETLRYVEGMHRDLDPYTYYRLLSSFGNNDNFHTGDDIDLTLQAELKKHRETESYLLTDFIYRWTRDLNGVVDLLKTLHVVFGRRDIATIEQRAT